MLVDHMKSRYLFYGEKPPVLLNESKSPKSMLILPTNIPIQTMYIYIFQQYLRCSRNMCMGIYYPTYMYGNIFWNTWDVLSQLRLLAAPGNSRSARSRSGQRCAGVVYRKAGKLRQGKFLERKNICICTCICISIILCIYIYLHTLHCIALHYITYIITFIHFYIFKAAKWFVCFRNILASTGFLSPQGKPGWSSHGVQFIEIYPCSRMMKYCMHLNTLVLFYQS